MSSRRAMKRPGALTIVWMTALRSVKVVVLAVACLTASSRLPGRGGAEGPTYEGRAATAAWRLQAAASIEKHRKADLVVVVKDAHAHPVEGAVVEVEQIRHAFPFGTAV